MRKFTKTCVVLHAVGLALNTFAADSILLRDWLNLLRRQGHPILYSSELIDEKLAVESDDFSFNGLSSVLQSNGMELQRSGETWLIVRSSLIKTAAKSSDTETTSAPVVESTIITGSRFNLPRDRTAYTSRLIDSRTMSSLPALAGDALRVVNRLPGMAAVGVSARPHVRGGLQDEMLIFLDGVELLEPFHLSDFQSLISSIDERAVAQMDVYTGGFPARYGKRMSGVMDLSTDRSSPEFNSELHASLYTQGGSSRGDWQGDNPGRWFVSARRGNFKKITNRINSRGGKPEFWDLMGQFDMDLGPDSLLSMGALATRDDATLRDEEDTASSKIERVYLWSRLEKLLAEKVHAAWTLSLVDSAHRKQEISISDVDEDIAQSIGSLDYRQDFKRISTANDYRVRLNTGLLEFGLQANWSEADYSRSRNFERSILGELLGTGDAEEEQLDLAAEGWSAGAYASLEWTLGPRLSLQPGLRFDYQDYSPGSSYRYLSPRLGLLYRIDENQQIRLTAGRFYQAEEVHEMQFLDGETRFFRPQHADQLILSYQGRTGPFNVSAEAWHKQYGNLKRRYENLYNTFVLLPYTEPDRVPLDPEKAFARGIDLELAVDNGLSMAAALHYSFLEAKDKLDGRWTPRRWSQRHTVGAYVWWRKGPFLASAALTWHSGWRSTAMPKEIASGETLDYTQILNNTRLREYYALDLGASYRWRMPRAEVVVFADLTNVFDRNNLAGLDYDVEEDEDKVFFIRTNDTLLSIIPTIGITIAF